MAEAPRENAVVVVVYEGRDERHPVPQARVDRASVLAVGRETDPPRELEGGAELELLEENDAGKKVPSYLLKRRRQVLVEVPQEMHNCNVPLTAPPPITTANTDASVTYPAAQPPYRGWVDL